MSIHVDKSYSHTLKSSVHAHKEWATGINIIYIYMISTVKEKNTLQTKRHTLEIWVNKNNKTYEARSIQSAERQQSKRKTHIYLWVIIVFYVNKNTQPESADSNREHSTNIVVDYSTHAFRIQIRLSNTKSYQRQKRPATTTIINTSKWIKIKDNNNNRI